MFCISRAPSPCLYWWSCCVIVIVSFRNSLRLDPSHLFVNLLLHEWCEPFSHFQHIFSILLCNCCLQCKKREAYLNNEHARACLASRKTHWKLQNVVKTSNNRRNTVPDGNKSTSTHFYESRKHQCIFIECNLLARLLFLWPRLYSSTMLGWNSCARQKIACSRVKSLQQKHKSAEINSQAVFLFHVK